MCDAVITWVDGKSPSHKKKRADLLRKENDAHLARGASHPTRFTSSVELEYCIESIRKFAPWIDVVYLVTDQQCPDWLTEKTRKELKVVIVDHAEIFSGYENVLPTFSSRSIETMLYRIPNLKEHFIYLNDDFFFCRPTSYNDWFQRNKPIVRGRWRFMNSMMYKFQIASDLLISFFRPISKFNGLVGLRAEHKMLESRRIFQLAHSPFPMTRSLMKSHLEASNLHEKNIRFRFRHESQFNPFCLVTNLALSEGKALTKTEGWSCLGPKRKKQNRLNKLIAELGSKKGFETLCIQSLDQFSTEEQADIENGLDQLVTQYKDNASLGGTR